MLSLFVMPLWAQNDTAALPAAGAAVVVEAARTLERVKQGAFPVTVVNGKELRNRNADVNRVLDALPGMRVRESGGMGSAFEYSINGLSGKAVKFFIDGIPMETMGGTFSINNIPVNVIDRIEVYKGVTPAELGGDALGGAVHIITRKDVHSFLDASYSYGSFNTHRAAVSGKWYTPRSGFTLSANGWVNHSDNNYQVWGNTVEVADENGRPIAGNHKYRRFNDDYRAISGRVEAGFTNTALADQLLLSFTLAHQHKGIQTGRTMAFVYGDVRYKEKLLMPSLRYAKKNWLVRGLQVDLFAALNRVEGSTIDTGSNKYNWAGAVITSGVNGELNGIRAQKSLYTFTDHTRMAVAHLGYQLVSGHTISLNTNARFTTRKGSDAIARAEWTIPFREPQHLNKIISGLSYQAQLLNGKWTNSVFVKSFAYTAEANVYDYNGGQQKELITYRTSKHTWGVGYGTVIKPDANRQIKFSVENASRLPEAQELLGDGNTILNAPMLQPERSLNMNAAYIQRIPLGKQELNLEGGVFFRNTSNLIWLGEGDLFGTARYENINKLRSMGIEASVAYTNKKWLEVSANATWQDVRNRQRYTTSGARNIVYNDRMKNMPAVMANAEVRLYTPAAAGKRRISVYVNTHFVQSYFLNWPSLGDPATKKRIPQQWVQDAGITYAFPGNACSITVECRNLLNKQVYDNYLLQKPGRFASVQIRYFFSQVKHNQ